MTARMTGRTRRSVRRRALPFPVFLLMVCTAVTIGATSVRALTGTGEPTMGGVLAGTAGRVLAFLDYFAGVFTLLSLTAAVVCGLAATDRLVLSPRQRIAMQSVHRATSVAALGFLVTHIAVKVIEQDASPLTALLPFSGGATFAVGLGTLAADLLVLTAATGAVRGRFAGSRRPWLWRVLHAGAYACWPIALAHGLTAGRQAAVWVLWSYGLCAAAVGLALLVRLLGAAGRGGAKRRGARTLLAYEASAPGADAARSAGRGPARRPARETVPASAAGAGSGSESVEQSLRTASHANLGSTFAYAGSPDAGHLSNAFANTGSPDPGRFGNTFADAGSAVAGVMGDEFGDAGGQGGVGAGYAMSDEQGMGRQGATFAGPFPDGYAYPSQPQPAAAYGYPSAWGDEAQARPHPALAETPPHGFAVPGDLAAGSYAGPNPGQAPMPVSDWLYDSADWGPLTWDTPPNGIPVPEAAPPAYAAQTYASPQAYAEAVQRGHDRSGGYGGGW